MITALCLELFTCGISLMQKESDIIKGLRNGESFAFDWIYQHCFTKATAYIAQHRGSTQDAEDFFQEALFVLVEKLRNPHFKLTSSCATFLYAVVRNLWLYHQRNAGRMISTEAEQLLRLAETTGEDFWHLLEAAQEQENQAQQVMSAMNQLSEECHQLLLLSFYDNKNDDEIAQIMAYSRNFIKVKRFRCLSKLKEIIGL